jgi:rhamnosyltransferase
MANKYQVGVATVFFHPDEKSIENFKSLADYGYVVAIANNGMTESDLKSIQYYKDIIIIGNGMNVGLAKAMNDAVYALMKNSPEIDSYFLLDQDSKPDYSLPNSLRESYFLNCEKNKVACLGPRIHDEKSSLPIVERSVRFKEAQTIATSGTLIPRDKFEEIGSLKEELFIDCIDHEWCFRARSQGMKIVIDNNLIMKHNMGEDGIDWFGSYKPIYRSPIRHYYIVRNSVVMLKTQYIPISWRILEYFKLIRRVVFYVVFSTNRIKTTKNIFQAIGDGVIGKLGAKS